MSADRPAEDRLPSVVLKRLVWLWLIFCAAKISSAVLHNYSERGLPLWKPLLWEGSSLLVVGALIAIQLRFSVRSRHLHSRPWLWFRDQLLILPLMSIVFVPATYGLRHAVYAMLGETYEHGPWLRVFAYESTILSVFYLLWLSVIYGLATHEHLLAERIRAQETALALREAHLILLRQQLQPHFLFNALNLISAAMYENVPRADALLRKLAGFLRQASAHATKATHRLNEELALLHDYADIMTARFEGRVEISWEIAEGMPDCEVPSMISQPLLENAFKHGVEPFAGSTHLVVRLTRPVATRLCLSIVQDRGTYAEDHGARGQGIANVRRRLTAHYGDDANLQIRGVQPEGVCVTLDIPCAF